MTNPLILIFDWERKHETSNVTTVSVTGLAGAMIGSLMINSLDNIAKLGRRKSVIVFNIFPVLGASIQLIDNFEAICVGRFIFGYGTGGLSVILTRMIEENCPTELLGEIGVLNNVSINTGIMLAYFFGMALEHEMVEETWYYWRINFSFPIFFSII